LTKVEEVDQEELLIDKLTSHLHLSLRKIVVSHQNRFLIFLNKSSP